MRYASEHEFNREWSAMLTAAGALVIPAVGSAMQRPGLPDRYVAHSRFVGWIEGKKDARRLTTAQRIVMGELAVRGVPALVFRYLGADDVALIRTRDEDTLVQLDWACYADGASPQQAGQQLLGEFATATKSVGILRVASG